MTAPGHPSAAALLSVALEAAGAAVELVHRDRPSTLQIATKSTATDLVTEMDRAAEGLIRSIIAAARPADRFVGEESASDEDDTSGTDRTGVTWWVDPIDGTTNYVYDHPGYAVSIAAAVDGEVVAGVVADPTHGRTYRATLGGGARCSETMGGKSTDRRLELAAPPPLDHALVATGFAYDGDRRRAQGQILTGVLPRVRDIRRMGAAALDLCSVASGRVDAYYEAGLSMWDFAAGALVATEAGARVGGIDGGPVRPGSVLAAHPVLFDQMVSLLAELGA
ncbi:MAG: inositol monophosphatase [Actinobacteria bacterium]|nr:inositol monophosphatase [Actinomycetota bacterium]